MKFRNLFKSKKRKHLEKLKADFEAGKYLRFSTKTNSIDNKKIMEQGGK